MTPYYHEERIDCTQSLPFLDMIIQRSEGGVVFDVYRKPTHTDKYLNRDSCHPPQVFKGLVAGLKKRVVIICSSSRVSSELHHLRDAWECLLSEGLVPAAFT